VRQPGYNGTTSVKNSLLRGRNTEQDLFLKMMTLVFGLLRVVEPAIKLFGITASKDLRQFHARGAITPRLFEMPFYCF